MRHTGSERACVRPWARPEPAPAGSGLRRARARWGSRAVGAGGVVAVAVRAAGFLHLRLVQVVAAFGQLVQHAAFESLERLVVGVVVGLDDLERPVPRDDVAAQDLLLDPVGRPVVAGSAQQFDRVTEFQIRTAGQLMEGVQVAAGPLGRLQRLGQCA
uniref:Uncharacterized protein n=1 Tax=Streptomyces avermitilis TaxID=33903 RepID=A0A499V539_STRAX|nr:hypothetical protein SAVMC3_12710 [Streptomyces avermitilis]